jgi:hypothetical protein
MMKSRKMRWARHVARMEEEEESMEDIGEKIKGKRPQRKENVNTLIALKYILEGYDVVVWTGLVCLRIGNDGGLL